MVYREEDIPGKGVGCLANVTIRYYTRIVFSLAGFLIFVQIIGGIPRIPAFRMYDTSTQIPKYADIQIHKYANAQIHKFTNSQICKYN